MNNGNDFNENDINNISKRNTVNNENDIKNDINNISERNTANNGNDFNDNKFDLNLSISVKDITYGDDAIIEVNTDNRYDGPVDVIIDENFNVIYECLITNGYGQIRIPNLEVRNYTVCVIASESKFFRESRANSTFKVRNKLIDPQLNITADNIIKGEIAIISINVNHDFNGYVHIKLDDDKQYRLKLVQGSGIIKIPNLVEGKHVASVIFDETEIYYSSEKNVTFIVELINPNLSIYIKDFTIDENGLVGMEKPLLEIYLLESILVMSYIMEILFSIRVKKHAISM